ETREFALKASRLLLSPWRATEQPPRRSSSATITLSGVAPSGRAHAKISCNSAQVGPTPNRGGGDPQSVEYGSHQNRRRRQLHQGASTSGVSIITVLAPHRPVCA